MKLHAGNIVLIGFGVMILFMSWLVYRCIQNPSMMVADNYYEQELTYQDVIDAKQNVIPYTDSIIMKKEVDQVVVQIPQSLNSTLSNAKLIIYNKSNDKKDKLIDLSKNESGLYVVNTTTWEQVSYTLKLSFESVGKKFYKEFSF